MPSTSCPTEKDLTAYQLGELPPEQAAGLALHLEECSTCAADLARLDGLTDGVIAALRQCPRPDGLQISPANTFPLYVAVPVRAEPLHSLPDYEVLEEIGRGGMGVVYKARQLRLNRAAKAGGGDPARRDRRQPPGRGRRFHVYGRLLLRP